MRCIMYGRPDTDWMDGLMFVVIDGLIMRRSMSTSVYCHTVTIRE